MGKRISWQPKPVRQMEALERYFREELGTVQAFEHFLEKLEAKLARISNYPESGHFTGRKNVRYVQIDKQRNIFYRVRRDHLQILLLWDVRQDPVKNPYLRTGR